MTDDHCGTRTYREELELTRALIDRGDRAHALHHCVGAVALKPNRREWQPLLDDLLRDSALVAKLGAETFVGAHAARAWHMRGRGELAGALEVVAQVACAMPDAGYQRWFGAWLEEAAAKHLIIEPGPVLQVLQVGASVGIGRIELLPSERVAAADLVPIARFAAEVIDDADIVLFASAILRRAGLHREAISTAQRAAGKVAPDRLATMLGLALRANHDYDNALEVFEAAFAHSRDVTYLQEQLRVLADAGRWREAVAIADRVEALRELDGENENEHAFVRRAAASGAPTPTSPPLDMVRRRALGHGFLYAMGDATANVLRQVGEDEGLRAKGPTGLGEAMRSGNLEVAVRGSEGPSNRLALALMIRGLTDPRLVTYSIDANGPVSFAVDSADQYTTWKLDEGIAVQALPVPADAVLDWVERVALHEPTGADPSAAFDTDADFLDMWAFARGASPPTASARDWVAATVHPRMPLYRVGMGPDWVYRWQVASLIGLAQLPGVWDGSSKRDALFSLLHGVIDWPLVAAIRVAAEIALHEPEAIGEIRRALIELSSRVVDLPNPATAQTLLVALEMLPYVSAEYTDRLRRAIAAPAQQDENAVDGAESPAMHDSGDPRSEITRAKRPWWKFWA